MRKIFKKFKLRDLIFFIIGGLVIGSIGITATTNKLEAKYVMYTKDGETMTVQDAIKDLYGLAKNGSSQTLPLGDVMFAGSQMSIPYTGIYDKVTCVYGTTENYGSTGTINGNKCTIIGNSNTKYYYKLIATKIENNKGTVYENSGSATTYAGHPTKVTSGLPTGVKAIVYLDPTDLSKSCNASNSTVGSGTSGCMKWYAFKEDTNSYTMILDHNTYAKGTWENTKSALTTLKSQTGWNNLNTRMITANEIATITGNTSFNSATSTDDKWFYLDSNTQTQTAKSQGASKFYWLFDYTSGCTSYGCNVADSSNSGYWTPDAVHGYSTDVWFVSFGGVLGRINVSDTSRGLRPVITVSKSNF